MVICTGSLGRGHHKGGLALRALDALARQLVEGGRLVVPISNGPIGEELTRLRLLNGRWETESLGPCRFVPLIGADGYEGDEPG